VSTHSNARVLGRGLAALITTSSTPAVPSTPTPVSSDGSPLKRLGEVIISGDGDTDKSYALGHGSLYFLVDEEGDVDVFGRARARVVDFEELSQVDLVQTIGRLCERVVEQDRIIGEMQEREKLSRSTKLRR